jgi:hypothetical protein
MATQDIHTQVSKAIKWLAAESKYMNDVYEDLLKLEEDIEKANTKRKLKDIKKALKDFKQVGKCELRAHKFEKTALEDLKRLEANHRISINLSNEELAKLKQSIQVHARKILDEASRGEGKIRKQLVELQKLIKAKKEKEARNKLKELEEEVSNTLDWIHGLIIEDQRLMQHLTT